MTTYYLADDGEGIPTLFARDQITLEPFAQRDVAVLRRSDLAPDKRRFWPEIVERMTTPEIVSDILRAKAAVDAAPAYKPPVARHQTFLAGVECKGCSMPPQEGSVWCETCDDDAYPDERWKLRTHD